MKPRPALPAQPERVTTFNKRVGIDIKYVTGWKVNQKIPAVNIIDYASSFQVVVPLFERVTATAIRRTIQERWTNWAGQPDEILCDPARTNLADALTTPNELAGSVIHVTAADAHYQLGKVEVPGGWFNQILEKIIYDCSPADQDTWTECMHAAHCKNELIQVYGMTPAQFIFGRNPKTPENLMDEPCEVIPATASLYEAEIAKRVAIRQAARQAVVTLQDSKALRLALSARPRHQVEPVPGDMVAYWRSQKWDSGSLDNHGRWHGPAIVLGKVGRNLVIVHKRQVLRCAPEQIRASTTEERQLVRAPHAELLGLKHAFETGQIASRQYVDLVSGDYPTVAAESAEQPQMLSGEPEPAPFPVASDHPRVAEPLTPAPAEETVPPAPVVDSVFDDEVIEESSSAVDKSPAESSTYGPVRRRVTGKNGPQAFFRPSPMRPDDFSEMMEEIMPRLMEQVLQDSASADSSMQSSSPRGSGAKRAHSRIAQTRVKLKVHHRFKEPMLQALLLSQVGLLLKCCHVPSMFHSYHVPTKTSL